MRDISRQRLEEYCNRAEVFRAVDAHSLGRKALAETYRGTGAALFFEEPSTRTYSGFKMGLGKLGAIDVSLTGVSASTAKGETLGETALTLGALGAEVIIMRTKKEDAVAKAAEMSEVPIINAGDGANEHPSQAILDVATLLRRFGRVAGLHVAKFGDLGYARTSNSLDLALGMYPDVRITLVPSPGLDLTPRSEAFLKESGLDHSRVDSLEELIDLRPDVLFGFRSQAERHPEGILPPSIILTPELLDALPNAAVLHAGPHGPEIPDFVQGRSQALFATEQVSNGLYTRIALIDEKLGSHAYNAIQEGKIPYNESFLAA
ncbi:MAG TPA: hypothetical protein VH144_03080 [Candidatus Saccharimonadales bacterium]|nr:hypothetical protein [Candidatus Saccharimonadales bacterium]